MSSSYGTAARSGAASYAGGTSDRAAVIRAGVIGGLTGGVIICEGGIGVRGFGDAAGGRDL